MPVGLSAAGVSVDPGKAAEEGGEGWDWAFPVAETGTGVSGTATVGEDGLLRSAGCLSGRDNVFSWKLDSKGVWTPSMKPSSPRFDGKGPACCRDSSYDGGSFVEVEGSSTLGVADDNDDDMVYLVSCSTGGCRLAGSRGLDVDEMK